MLRAALPAGVEVAYAVEGEPVAGRSSRLLAAWGSARDIASAGELASRHPGRVRPAAGRVHGPGKTDAELAAAIRRGSPRHHRRVAGGARRAARAGAAGRPAPGLCSGSPADEPSRGAEGTPIIGAAGAAKFGLLRDELDEASTGCRWRVPSVARARPSSCWVHAFGASNVRDAGPAAGAASVARRPAEEVAAPRPRFRCSTRVAASASRTPTTSAAGSRSAGRGPRRGAGHVGRSAGGWPTRACCSSPALPGRSGGRVPHARRATKQLDGRTVAIIDGGIHHVLRPALVREPQRIGRRRRRPPSRAGRRRRSSGRCAPASTSSSADVCCPTRARATCSRCSMSAPTASPSPMPLFLSHPIPARRWSCRGGVARVARLRQEPGGVVRVVW